MPRAFLHTKQIIKLNGERVTRTYTAEVINFTELEKKSGSTYSACTERKSGELSLPNWL